MHGAPTTEVPPSPGGVQERQHARTSGGEIIQLIFESCLRLAVPAVDFKRCLELAEGALDLQCTLGLLEGR